MTWYSRTAVALIVALIPMIVLAQDDAPADPQEAPTETTTPGRIAIPEVDLVDELDLAPFLKSIPRRRCAVLRSSR